MEAKILKMFRFSQFCRLLSSAPKSNLAKLRQRTGFPISKCKDALTRNSNELEAAEKWLYEQAQKEGWAKVEKLQGRAASQGLIGLLLRGKQAAMVEVNCETDFVARNEKFQSLLSSVTETALGLSTTGPPSTAPLSVGRLTRDDIMPLPVQGEQTVGDLVAQAVGNLGENLVISRGCVMAASRGLLCGFVYNNMAPAESAVAMGTYGALLHMLPETGEEFSNPEPILTLGNRICQHIVGLNPEVVKLGSKGVKDPSRALLSQEYLLDQSVTVGDLLEKNKAKVTKFVRYSLGESTTDTM